MVRKNKHILLFVGAVTLLLLLLVFILNPHADSGRIYTHIYIHGVPVGGMSRIEAEALLMEKFQAELEEKTIQYIVNGEIAAEYTFADFGAELSFGELVDAALEYSYLRNLPRRIGRLFGRPHEIDEPPGFRFNPARIEDVMGQLSRKLDKEPVNAAFSEKDGSIAVTPETAGQGIDREAAARHTQELLNSRASGAVTLEIVTVEPGYTKADFDFPVSVLGVYSTPYTGGSDDPRVYNVRLAASRINNQMLYPGEVFSAGTNIAAHLPNSGYKAAIVLVRGEPVEDVGGGVCQVVTTLYNAVLLAELAVVQRHNHSAMVSYADLGFDATIAGDYFDLKFKNNTSHPLLITSYLNRGQLYVRVLGYEARPPERTLRFEAVKTETIEPESYREVVDSEIPRGERHVILESQRGYRVELYKVVYVNGRETERVKINTSVYMPLQGVIAIGAGQ